MPIATRDLLAGVGLDLAFGDPQWLPHPVRGIGWLATRTEHFWRDAGMPLGAAGACFWIGVVGVSTGIVALTPARFNVYWIYSLLACRDLDVHATDVVAALSRGDLAEARRRLSWIVGRDTAELNEAEILRAVIETVAENLCDGVVSPLFYLALGGPAAMAAYKAINTLDSIVGHRNELYRDFGTFSARADDVANFIPARLSGLLICAAAAILPGLDGRRAGRTMMRDGGSQPSPNAGYPEGAAAGALGVRLGGVNYYGGVPSSKPFLGDAERPIGIDSFRRMRTLLYVSTGLCVALIVGCKRWR